MMSVFLTPSLFTMTGAKTQPEARKAVNVDALQKRGTGSRTEAHQDEDERV
jgi:hypothetical protein